MEIFITPAQGCTLDAKSLYLQSNDDSRLSAVQVGESVRVIIEDKQPQPMSNGVKKKFKELEDKIDDLTINFQEKLGSHKGFYQKYSDNLTETINRLSK